MKVVLNGQSVHVEIERKKVKNLNMRLSIDGIILISAPFGLPEERIEEFILSKSEWILKHLEVQKKRKEAHNLRTFDRPVVQVLGKRYYLVIHKGNNEGFELEGDIMQLTCKDESRVISVFEKQAKEMLMSIFEQKRIRLDQVMDDYRLAHPEITVRKMKGKWGSCTPSKAKIVMNQMLIHVPVKCIEYVLIHEYMHMICPDHSKRFYSLVQNLMPDYKSCMKILKEE